MDFKNLSDKIFRAIPKLCHLCRETISSDDISACSAFLCSGCRQDLALNLHCCRCCAVPMPATQTQGPSIICGECLKRPPAFTASFCPFIYTFPLDRLISDFKSSGKWQYGHHLATLFLNHIDQYKPSDHSNQPELISFVPLHRKRLWQRGFNQSELLARRLAKMLNLPVVASIQKTRATSIQHTLKRSERMKNLKHAFRVKNAPAFRGKHVALVDDVVTTGATSNVLAKLLIDAGARQVDIWALARTPKSK